MASAKAPAAERQAKQHTLNEIQIFQFWKLSHCVRRRSICVQIESAEPVSVTCGKTKKGRKPTRRSSSRALSFQSALSIHLFLALRSGGGRRGRQPQVLLAAIGNRL